MTNLDIQKNVFLLFVLQRLILGYRRLNVDWKETSGRSMKVFWSALSTRIYRYFSGLLVLAVSVPTNLKQF